MSDHRKRSRRLIVLVLMLACAIGFCVYAVTSGHRPVATVRPPEPLEPGRWVFLDGANNTRDIGGYRTADGRHVRWRLVYRSGKLSGLTDAGAEAYRNLGVRRVIDFRYRVASSPLFGGDAFSVFRVSAVTLLPIRSASSDSDAPAYVQSVREHQERYRQAFELVADPVNLPALFHCLKGKDRTGIMAGLLLTLLGVDRETVLRDYALTELVEPPVNRQAMTDLLDEVDRQGGIEKYLSGIGVSAAVQQAIRQSLLE